MTNKSDVESCESEGSPMNLHVANIMSFQYEPIHCLALNDTNTKAALFRGGDTPAIEVWDVSHNPFVEKILYDLESVNEKVSVESLAWVNDRLFSCGLHGFVVEHDLVTQKMKRKYMATSGPVWNLSVNPDRTLLGAATEDGFINIFEVVEDELLFQKVLDRQEGRILCLSWSPCGRYIATGSVDNVRVWDVERRHAMQRLSTGRSKKNETIVWTVLIIDELTVVSGDSRGVVSFWDGRLGVLMFKIFTHRADILCMNVSPDNSTIYVAGVDPSVVLLSRVGKMGDKWVRSHQRNMHTNDVLCLATIGNKLISGGVDCELTVSIPPMRHMPRIIRKYPPIHKPPPVFLSRNSRRVLIQEPRGISVWQLPFLDKELVRLIDFKSRGGEVINSASISSSGKAFAYSSGARLRCFRLVECADGRIIPVKLRKAASASVNIKQPEDFNLDMDSMIWIVNFLNETQLCAISVCGSCLQIIEIHEHNDSYTVKPEVILEDYIDPSGITLVATDAGGNNLCVSTAAGQVYLIELSDKGTVADSQTLPAHTCPVTTVEFHPFQPYILVTYADHTARIYNFLNAEVVFHEELGGPKMRMSDGGERRKKAKRKPGMDVVGNDGTQDSSEPTAAEHSRKNEDCHNPVVGTSWSEDGRKIVFQEISMLHLLEVTNAPLKWSGHPDDAPTTKKAKKESSSREKRGGRGSSASPVPSALRGEEWTSDKTLLTSRLQSLSVKHQRNGGVDHSGNKVLVSWKSLRCDKAYKYVAAAKFLGDSTELLLVEVKPSSLLSKLPPAFARKRFGM